MAKTSTLMLPKKVAGLEVPKKVAGLEVAKVLRRGVLAELLNSPVARFALAEALVAGAAAAATALRNHKTTAEGVDQSVDAVESTGSEVPETPEDAGQSTPGGISDMANGDVPQTVPTSSVNEDPKLDPVDKPRRLVVGLRRGWGLGRRWRRADKPERKS